MFELVVNLDSRQVECTIPMMEELYNVNIPKALSPNISGSKKKKKKQIFYFKVDEDF